MYGQHAAVSRLLLMHPDARIRAMVARLCDRQRWTLNQAVSLREGLETLERDGAFGVILCGLRAAEAPVGTAEFAEALRPVVPLAGQGQIIVLADYPLDAEACFALVRLGVSAVVDSTADNPDEATLTERIDQARRRFEQSHYTVHPAEPSTTFAGDSMVWKSPQMGELLTKAARAAQVSDVPVLIFGESGTGKQLLAELIHRLDPKRARNRFLSVNCSTISGTLAESTLFGHVKGAYTGAAGARKGIFRAADGGTVLLDEIGEMDLALQPKLLRALQEGVVMPLGADDEVPIDVRVIAASNRRLAAAVEEKTFRLDLFQRLNVIALEIPPLRERPEDVPVLVRFFVNKYADYYSRAIESIDPRLIEFLTGCTLRGNVRELENIVRQMLAFKARGAELSLDDLPPGLGLDERSPQQCGVELTTLVEAACRLVDNGAMTLPELISLCEKTILRNTLENSRSTSSDVARQLGLSRRTLYNKIRKYRLGANGRNGADDLDRAPRA